VLVHRTELLKQWQERLRLFLQTSNDIGVIGGGKNKPGGDIDIAVMQSISRHELLLTTILADGINLGLTKKTEREIPSNEGKKTEVSRTTDAKKPDW